MKKIPILLYHAICDRMDQCADNFSVTPEDFKLQMESLSSGGFAGVSLEKITAEGAPGAESANPKNAPKKAVLTFDDGDVSNYRDAFPLLREKGFTATFFVTVNEIGKKGRMDWVMIQDLVKSGMEVGSHGLNHSFLTTLDSPTIQHEFSVSKQILEKNTGRRVDFISIPHGFYDRRVLAIAHDAGFRAVCISDVGYNDFSAGAPFILERFPVRRRQRIQVFMSVANGRPSLSWMAGERLRSNLRKMLGPRIYDALRNFAGGAQSKRREGEEA